MIDMSIIAETNGFAFMANDGPIMPRVGARANCIQCDDVHRLCGYCQTLARDVAPVRLDQPAPTTSNSPLAATHAILGDLGGNGMRF
jgi:hypothetical protein